MSDSMHGINQKVHDLVSEYGAKNISPAIFMCDRYADIPERTAFFYESAQGDEARITFRELKALSARLAGFLQSTGVKKGDRVAVMLPKCPETVITLLAIMRLGAVYIPLFTAFGPDAIDQRVLDSKAGLLITNHTWRSKVSKTKAWRSGKLDTVTVCSEKGQGLEKGDYSFWHELSNAEPVTKPALVDGGDLMCMVYTSGTTGQPKGVQVPVKALASFEAYMRFGMDLKPQDFYWNLADPGWAYGLWYNLMGSLLVGKSCLFYDGPFYLCGIKGPIIKKT